MFRLESLLLSTFIFINNLLFVFGEDGDTGNDDKIDQLSDDKEAVKIEVSVLACSAFVSAVLILIYYLRKGKYEGIIKILSQS